LGVPAFAATVTSTTVAAYGIKHCLPCGARSASASAGPLSDPTTIEQTRLVLTAASFAAVTALLAIVVAVPPLVVTSPLRLPVWIALEPPPVSSWPLVSVPAAVPQFAQAMTPLESIVTGEVAESAPPLVVVEQVGHVKLPVVGLRTSGDEAPTAKVPAVLGSVSVGVPAVACG
jgi:hypothetical protein